MLLNFVRSSDEHRLPLDIPLNLPQLLLPASTRFFIVHVVYSRDDPNATMHVLELYGPANVTVTKDVQFGQ